MKHLVHLKAAIIELKLIQHLPFYHLYMKILRLTSNNTDHFMHILTSPFHRQAVRQMANPPAG